MLYQSVVEYASMTLTSDLKIYRCLPFIIFLLCMKYQVCRLKIVWVIRLQQSMADYVSMTLTFDLLTPKYMHLCMKYDVSRMKVPYVTLGWKFFWVITLQQSVDRQTHQQTDKVITIGLQHIWWRGPNYICLSCTWPWNKRYEGYKEH